MIYDKFSFPSTNLKGVTMILFEPEYFLYVLFVPFACLLYSLLIKYSAFLMNNTQVVTKLNKINASSENKYLSKNINEHKFNRIKQYTSCLNKIYVPNGLNIGNNQDEDKDYYSTCKYFLHFKHPYLENIYKKQ